MFTSRLGLYGPTGSLGGREFRRWLDRSAEAMAYPGVLPLF